MKPLLVISLATVTATAAPTATPDPRSPFEAQAYTVPQSHLDGLILTKLAKENLSLAPPCSDAVFVRRVFLDLIGTLPTAGEVTAFLDDATSDKRAKLIERLFQRSEFADYWSMRWCDLLRVKAEFPINLWPNPAQAYHRLLRNCVQSRLPVDRMARGLLTATGSNMRVPEANFFRAVQSRDPKALAAAASLAFMGVRQETWTPSEMDALSACFSRVGYKATSEWKEEIVFFDQTKPAPAKALTMPDGKVLSISPDLDPRAAFADWLVSPENPWFARHFANRAWFWLFGRGIVHEPDDFRRDNPPSHPELLAYLARELSDHGFDLQHLLRLITNSRTYQQSSVSTGKPRSAGLFANYPMRRLDAEVLIDALCAVTATTESYSSPIPEPFTFLPEGTRAIALPDGSISSAFLELFGRPSRDSGLAAERNLNPSAAQRLHFLNSSHVRTKIEKSPLLRDALLRDRPGANGGVTRLYLTILSRRPTPDEMRIFRDTIATAANRRDAVVDLTWSLLNTTEFLCRH